MVFTRWGFSLGLSDAVDIIATAFLAYYLLLLIRGTRAVRIMIGVFVLLVVLGISTRLHLLVLTTVLQYLLVGTAVGLLIVFQPELRRALEQLGRGGVFARREVTDDPESSAAALTLIARVAMVLAQNRTGALIAIEQSTGLREFGESGTRLDARLSIALLLSIFSARSPLHDGAVIIQDRTIEAAGCFLPLSDNVDSGTLLGTRAPRCACWAFGADRCRGRGRVRTNRSHLDRSYRPLVARNRRRAAATQCAPRLLPVSA